MERDFKGIWIPKDIWLSQDLTTMEKLFLIEIDSLDNDKHCYATNAYFSEFFDISKGRCTQIIKSLEAKKYITIDHEKEGKRITKRIITVVNKLNTPYLENDYTLFRKPKHPYLENAKENNTVINNTYNIYAENLKPNDIDEITWHQFINMMQEFEELKKFKYPLTIHEALRIKKDYPGIDIKKYLSYMENTNGVSKKYKSVNKTIRSWIDLDKKKNGTFYTL